MGIIAMKTLLIGIVLVAFCSQAFALTPYCTSKAWQNGHYVCEDDTLQ